MAVSRFDVPAPDPKPARRLRIRLAVLRADGVPFEEAWPDAVRFALEGVSREGLTWRSSFDWSKDEWQLAYERQPPARRLGVCETGDLRET